MTRQSQAQRNRARLEQSLGSEVPAIELHRASSESPMGFCASLSKRVHEIRQELLNEGGHF